MHRLRTIRTLAIVTIGAAVIATVGFLFSGRCEEIRQELESIRTGSVSVSIARREIDDSGHYRYSPGTDLYVKLDQGAVAQVIDIMSSAGIRDCQRYSPNVAFTSGDIGVRIDFASNSNDHAAQLLVFGDHAYLWSRTVPNRAWKWSVQHDVRNRLRSMIGDVE